MMSEWELNELVGRVGALYTRWGLCPPSRLRDAARHWLGLTHEEIIEVIETHFDHHRRLYIAGSGDAYFNLVEAAMRKAWEARHPAIQRAEDEPGRGRRKRAGHVRQIYRASGFTDAFDDREHPEPTDRRMAPLSPSAPVSERGYVGSLEDDE